MGENPLNLRICAEVKDVPTVSKDGYVDAACFDVFCISWIRDLVLAFCKNKTLFFQNSLSVFKFKSLIISAPKLYKDRNKIRDFKNLVAVYPGKCKTILLSNEIRFLLAFLSLLLEYVSSKSTVWTWSTV